MSFPLLFLANNSPGSVRPIGKSGNARLVRNWIDFESHALAVVPPKPSRAWICFEDWEFQSRTDRSTLRARDQVLAIPTRPSWRRTVQISLDPGSNRSSTNQAESGPVKSSLAQILANDPRLAEMPAESRQMRKLCPISLSPASLKLRSYDQAIGL